MVLFVIFQPSVLFYYIFLFIMFYSPALSYISSICLIVCHVCHHVFKNSGICSHLRHKKWWHNDDARKIEEDLRHMQQGMRHHLKKPLHETDQTTPTLDVCSRKLAELQFLSSLQRLSCLSCLQIYRTEK